MTILKDKYQSTYHTTSCYLLDNLNGISDKCLEYNIICIIYNVCEACDVFTSNTVVE